MKLNFIKGKIYEIKINTVPTTVFLKIQFFVTLRIINTK
jgi:hypothetical protein